MLVYDADVGAVGEAGQFLRCDNQARIGTVVTPESGIRFLKPPMMNPTTVAEKIPVYGVAYRESDIHQHGRVALARTNPSAFPS